MTNAELIAKALDGFLDHPVSLVVYGRAAIALGFDPFPEAAGQSMDIDVILPFSHEEELEADDQFWTAQAEVNRLLENQGLYMTHLFLEDQVFLRPDWEQHIVPVARPPTRWLQLFRPATVDLILTKMMRGNDPQDMEDVDFLIQNGGVSLDQMETAFAIVRIPDIQELHDAFAQALPVVRQLLHRII